MKRLSVVLIVVLSVVANAGENWQVLVGSDGSVKFQPPASEEVSYTSSGLVATPEAMKYPEEVKRLILEEIDFLPVKFKIVKNRMAGLLTWKVVNETELVLARTDGVLGVRVPVETENESKEEEVTSLFGLFVVIFFALLLVGNVAIWRNHYYFAFAVTFAASVVAAASIAAAAFAASVAAAAAFAASVAAAAFAASAAAAASVAAAAFVSVSDGKKTCQILSSISAGLMIIAVVMVI